MTSRYFRHQIEWGAYAERVPALVPPPGVAPPEPTYNAAPTSLQPVLRYAPEQSYAELAPCQWGLVPGWWTKPLSERKFTGFTAAAETAHEKPVYRGAFRHHRCLVPVSGFYAWTGPAGAKTPFAIGLRDTNWFCLAGLWDAALIEGSEIHTFTLLTTTPNDLMAGLGTRMPVILSPDNYERWLDPASGPVQDLFAPYPTDAMRAWPIGLEVGNVRNDRPDLIDEV